jgi:hypothetical protein
MNRRASKRRRGGIDFPTFHSGQREIVENLFNPDGMPFSVWRCGRRFGKTTALESLGANEARHGLQVGWFSPTYKLLAPSYKRILRLIKPAVEHSSKVDSLIETEAGGTVEFWTLSDEDAGRSRSYDLVIIDEGSLVKRGLRQTWEQSIRPTLLDRRGKAIMAGTPKGIDPENFFYEACNDDQVTDPKMRLGFRQHHAPTSRNPTLDPVGVANLQNEYPPLVYQQEFLAEFVDWSGAAFFSRDSMMGDDGLPVAWPDRCDMVFATIDTAVKTGKENDGTAVIYWAVNRAFGYPLIALDYDIVQIEGSLLEAWLPNVYRRLDELATTCGARMGSLGTFIEDKASGMILLQQAWRRNWRATAIDSVLTSVGKDERAISVSGYVYQRKVKMSLNVHNKLVNYKGQTRNHFESQIFNYRVGQKDQNDDILDCYTYGIAIALGDSGGM